MLMYIASGHRYMRGKEFGTSDYAKPEEVSKRLRDPNNDPTDSQNIVVVKKGFRSKEKFIMGDKNSRWNE